MSAPPKRELLASTRTQKGRPPLIVRVDDDVLDAVQTAAYDAELPVAEWHRRTLFDAVQRSRKRHGREPLPRRTP